MGLVLLTISGIRFLDMGLKAFVFTKADEQMKIDYMRPPTLYSLEKLESLEVGEETLSKDEKFKFKK